MRSSTLATGAARPCAPEPWLPPARAPRLASSPRPAEASLRPSPSGLRGSADEGSALRPPTRLSPGASVSHSRAFAALRQRSRSAAPDIRVGCSVAVGVDGGLAIGRRDHVDIRVIGRVAGTGADFEYLGVSPSGSAGNAVRVSAGNPRVAGAQDFSPPSVTSTTSPEGRRRTRRRQCANALARPRAGGKRKVDPELAPGSIAEFGALARATGHVER